MMNHVCSFGLKADKSTVVTVYVTLLQILAPISSFTQQPKAPALRNDSHGYIKQKSWHGASLLGLLVLTLAKLMFRMGDCL